MAIVLIADDEPDIRTVIQRMLARAGHTTSTAPDGRAALEQARTARPDLILTDHDMPHMTGLQLCDAIRRDPGLRHIPVVVISGRLLPDDPALTATRPSAVLAKPFTHHDLVTTVHALLQRPAPETIDASL